MNISGKIVFDKDVEFITTDPKSDQFLIYYRKRGELIKYSLPQHLIKEFTYDEINQKICKYCGSLTIISIDENNWECLNCGANKSVKPIPTEKIYIPKKRNRTVRIERPTIFSEIIKDNYDDAFGGGSFSHLQISGKKYRNVLHWFKLPQQLKIIIYGVYITIVPKFNYYENDYYVFLEYLWDLRLVHKRPPKHTLDDCRVCDTKYLKPPKDFNRNILKYKYPNMWNLVDGTYNWEIKDNQTILQIKWNKEEYFNNSKPAAE